MDTKSLLSFMAVAEKLKCNLRHSWTSSMRQESVAEHSWRLCIFSYLMRKDFPDLNMDKVLLMCLFHDIGEAVTGDIPAFIKTNEHENDEMTAIAGILGMFDATIRNELHELFEEINEQKTMEAKLFKALDKLEAIIQHNEAPLITWIPLEYELNLTYADNEVKAFPTLAALRDEIRNTTLKLVSESKNESNIK